MKLNSKYCFTGAIVILIFILLSGVSGAAAFASIYVPEILADQTNPLSGTGTGHKLMIITPNIFTADLGDLVDHKTETFMPTMLITLEYIYENYPGIDEPEKIKRAIEHFVSSDSIEYVMLVGDCDTFPIRWQLGHLNDHLIGDDDDPANDDKIFVAADYYYADLYNDTGVFNDWDANGNGYYGEIYRTDLNPDSIDPVPDVAVGRVPVSDAAQLQTYIDKVIAYETSAYESEWFKNILLIQKEWTDDIHAKEAIATALAPLEFSTTRFYEDILPEHYSGYIDGIPSVSTITDAFNSGYGFVSELYHGSDKSWDYLFSTENVSNLINTPMLPVIYSGACDTGLYYRQNIPYREYTDTSGTIQAKIDPGLIGATIPATPDPIQANIGGMGMGESFLVSTENGGIAYYGCLVTGETAYHKVLDEAFFTAYSLDHRLLGDMWEYAVNTFATTYDLQNLVANDTWNRICMMHTPSRFVLLGDPSLRVGGINPLDEPPGADWSIYSHQNARGMDIVLDDTGVTVAGYAWDPDGVDYWSLLESYDQYGWQLESATFDMSKPNQATSLIYDADNDRYMITGQKYNFFEESGHEYEDWWVWLMSADEDLNYDWDEVYGTPFNDYGNSILKDGDGYVIGGWEGLAWDTTTGSGYIVRTNGDGSLDWETRLLTDDTTGWLNKEIFSVEKTSAGGVILGTADGMVKAGLGDPPTFQWRAATVEYYAAKQTADGGYIGVGRVEVDVPDGDDYYDLVITKLDASGVVTWSETYGRHASVLGATGMNDVGYDVRELSEGYLVTGSTESYAWHGGSDMLLARFSLTGELEWDMCLGAEGNDEGRAMTTYFGEGAIVTGRAVKDGISRIWTVAVNGEKMNPTAVLNYHPESPVFVGETLEFSGKHSPDPDGWMTNYLWDYGDGTIGTGAITDHTYAAPGTYEVTLYVIDNDGLMAEDSTTIVVKDLELQWERTYGSGNDIGKSIAFTSDGGFIVAGHYTAPYTLDPKAWLFKTDSRGNMVWEEVYSKYVYEMSSAEAITLAYDGGYVFAGVGNKGDNDTEVWIVKVNEADQSIDWEYSFDLGIWADQAYDIRPDGDGYIITGCATAPDYPTHLYDLFLLRVNANGEKDWHRTYPDPDGVQTCGYAVAPTADGGYIVTGGYANGRNYGGPLLTIKIKPDLTEDWRTNTSATLNKSGGYFIDEVADGYVAAGTLGGDLALLKYMPDGVVDWQRTWDFESNYDYGNAAASYPDGGYIIVGSTYYMIDTTKYNDLYLVRTDGYGNVLWDYLTSTPGPTESALDVLTYPDGGCVVLAYRDYFLWLFKLGGNGAPTAAFDFDPAAPSIIDMVHFNAYSSSDDGIISQYLWDFGNGDTDTGLTADYRFPAPGTYDVTLTVIDTDGAEDSITQPVTVALATGPLAVISGPGSADEGAVVSFDGNDSIGNNLEYSWDFGDGGIVTGPSPTYTYMDDGIYTVTLTVTDDEDETDTDTTTIEVNDLAPVAAFSWSPNPQDEGLPVQFTDTSTSYPDDIVSWEWTFIGTYTSDEQNPTYTFPRENYYHVELRVTDDDGSESTVSDSVHIINVPPQAILTGDTIVGAGVAGSYDASASSSGPDSIWVYEWDWDYDGVTFEPSGDTGAIQTHAWTTEGEYTVAVQVTDADHLTDIGTLDVSVVGFYIDFSANVTSGSAPLSVEFTSSIINGAPPYTYAWDFDSNGTDESTEANPTFMFTKPGVYSVTLDITDDLSQTDTETKIDYIVATGISNDDAGVTIDMGDVTDDPALDPGTYDPALAPRDIDWSTARGFNLAASGPDGMYDFRITFDSPLTPGFLLYKIDPVSGEWTEIAYTAIDGYTIEVTLEITGGELDPPFVLAGISDSGDDGEDTGEGGGSSVGGGGGGGSTATDDKRFTNISGSSTAEGILWETVTALSVDIQLELVIPEGTKVLNANGYPVHSITVATLADPDDAPDSMSYIGNVYDLLPEGTVFDPPATLRISYDEGALPQDINEANLCIYTWNETSEQWEPLSCVVDTENNHITSQISHFSRYSILAGTQPAAFDIKSLTITPEEIFPGDPVTVSAYVHNNGDLAGTFESSLTLNGSVEQTRNVTLAGSESITIKHTFTAGDPGTYLVAIDNRQGTFTVVEPPAEAISSPIPIVTEPTSEPEPETTPIVSEPGQVTTPEPESTGTVAATILEDEGVLSWWVIVLIILAGVLATLLIGRYYWKIRHT